LGRERPGRARCNWARFNEEEGGNSVGSAEKPKRKKIIKYRCARCGAPLALHHCWIGNEGLLCGKHVVFLTGKKDPLDRENSPSA